MSIKICCTIDDDKARCLKRHGENRNVEFIISPFKEVFFPLYLLYIILFKGKPHALIVRYLNDKESHVSSFILYLSRYLYLSISVILNVKIIWFCHNIDKETSEYHPIYTNALRRFLLRYSEKIYVMDRLLVKSALRQFPESFHHKVDNINFGVRTESFRGVEQTTSGTNRLVSVLNNIRKNNSERVYIGFCPTNAGEKYLHIDYATDLVCEAEKYDIKIYIVLIGNLKRYFNKNKKLLSKIESCSRVVVIDEFLDYEADVVSRHFDFYWRGLSDESVSYSIYEAATQKKPTLALDIGFVGRAVEAYKLGGVLDPSMRDFFYAFEKILKWDSTYSEEFLESHSWDRAIDKITSIFSG